MADKLLNAERAVVEAEKLRDYSLNPTHPKGKHKARVFLAALGFTSVDADRLRQLILDAVLVVDAVAGTPSPYGARYFTDFSVRGVSGEVLIRAAWIIRNDEDFPRLPVATLWGRKMETIKLLDTVALTQDQPELSLRRGEVGTVVEVFAPGVFEVEFSDDSGEAYAFASLRAEQLLPLIYRKRAAHLFQEAA